MRTKSRLFKIFAVALVAIFALACLIGFAACEDDEVVDEDGAECEHENLTISEDESYDATCGKDGLTVEYCDDCGEKFETVIPATGEHVWDGGVVTKNATAYEEGETTYTCTVCGATKTEAIEKLKESEGLEFTLTSDGAGYAVTGIGTCTDVDIVIPSEYDGLPVVAIGEGAFAEWYILTIAIPSSVTTIGDDAFYSCILLTTVTFESNSECEIIGEAAFAYCLCLTSIVIPSSVAAIGDYAFSGCCSLTDVYYSGTEEEWTALQSYIGCDNEYLTSATIHFSSNGPIGGEDAPNTEDSVGLAYTLNEDQTGYAVTGIGTCTDRDIVIPAEYNEKPVVAIGNYAFAECYTLTSIVIPGSVTTIGTYAFSDCYSLTSVTFGEGVETIGGYAFYSCPSLRSVAIPSSVTSIGIGAFYGCLALANIDIPDGVTAIGTGTFMYCRSLKSVAIPDSVTTIGESAFSNCTSLTSVDIPGSVLSIGKYAFEGCTSLTSITIPDGVASIGQYAFLDCSSLTDIVIPKTMESIAESAFLRCEALENVYYTGTADEWTALQINVDYGNTALTGATIYYYSETEPADSGNWWHYVDGEIVVWGSQS